MTAEAAPLFIRRLLEPAAYPHPVDQVELIETHISWVLLAGDFAYKIKKPVNFGFLDFSTLEKRRFYCEEELRLNRRLAPTIYLEALSLTGSPSHPRLSGEGEAFDYALKMRRFSQDARLDCLLAASRLTPDHIDQLAKNLAAFHLSAPPTETSTPYGAPKQVLHPMAENFDQMRALEMAPADLADLDRLHAWTRNEFERLKPLLEARKQNGFIRECHGDLHLGNIVLLNGEPVPFDCIEFNDNLRWIDVISDLAFAVMDLTDRKHPDYARRLLNGWLEHTGDYDGLPLLRFYQVYRAMVRAKVAALRAAQQQELAERQNLQREYRGYIALAARLAKPAAPALLITHGFSGSGKTTLTQSLVERLGAIRLRSDVERKRLFGLQPLERSVSGPDGGIYTADATALTYGRLAELAAMIINAGHPTVVDATFLRQEQREAFQKLAHRLAMPFVILDFRAQEESLRKRIQQRGRAKNDASEADLAILEKQLATAVPFTDAETSWVIEVDTDSSVAVENMLNALKNRGLAEPPLP